MHRTDGQSTIVPDALAMIATCTESRPLMELAVALRAIISGTVLLPADRGETISRIARDLMNPHWNVQAHAVLKDPMVRHFAKTFCQACIQAVPLTPENPNRDQLWQSRVKAALMHDPSLQGHAKQLLGQIQLRVTPAPIMPVQAAQPKYSKSELQAKAKQSAEEFVRRREAQKAREAAQALAENAALSLEASHTHVAASMSPPEEIDAVREKAAEMPAASAPPRLRLRSVLRPTRLEKLLPMFQQSEQLHSLMTPPS